MSFVYFIHNERSEMTKIGWSQDPEKRLEQLIHVLNQPLVLLGSVPGDWDLENAYHRMFAEQRVEGEWFHDLPAFGSEALDPDRVRAWAAASLKASNERVARILDDLKGAEEALNSHLRSIPAGPKRLKAINECLDAGMSRSDVARALGVSRQRITQLLA